MGKGTRGKSSATAATRKKQAAKAAAKHGAPEPAAPTPKSGKKLSKKERQQLKKKSYVPPPKPPQPPPYPLDSMGLANLLPADLVVLLRKALKKDIVTRVRTLESMLAWMQGAPSDDAEPLDDEERSSAMVLMLPCWVHLFPRFALSPSQRLRLLALQVHEQLLRDAAVRDELLGAHNLTPILGFWAVLTHDTSRAAARLAQRLWDESVAWDASEDTARVPLAEYTTTLLEHFRPILLSDSPSANLAHSTASLQSAVPAGDAGRERDAKNRDETNVDESVEELDARLVACALGALASLVARAPQVDDDDLASFAESPTLWSALESVGTDAPLLGRDAPVVRQRAWAFLAALTARAPHLVDAHLATIRTHAFRGAWAERDVAVLSELLGALLPVLKRFPRAWTAQDDDSDAEDDADDDASEASEADAGRPLTDFLTWVQAAGVQAPRACFPAVLVFLSSMPADVLPYTPAAAAGVVRPLLALAPGLVERPGAVDPMSWDAYVAMVCECTAYLLMRIVRADAAGDGVADLATELLTALYDELVVGAADTPRPPARLAHAAAREWGRCLAKVDVQVEGRALLHDTLAHVEHGLDAPAAAPAGAADAPVDPLGATAAALTAALEAARAHVPPQDALATRLLALGGAVLERLCDAAAHATRALPVLSRTLRSPLGAAAPAASAALHRVATTHAAQCESPLDAAAFYEAYLGACADGADAEDVWSSLLAQSTPPAFAHLGVLLRVAQRTPPPEGPALRTWRDQVHAYLASDATPERATCFALLTAPPALLGTVAEDAVLAAAAAHVERSADADSIAALGAWHAHAPAERTTRFCSHDALRRALPAVYTAAHLRGDAQAHALWTSVAAAAPDVEVYAADALRAALLDGTAAPTAVLAAARTLHSAGEEDAVLRVLPDASQLDAALLVAAAPEPPVLHIVDPLVPLAPANGDEAEWHSLARIAHAYVAALEAEGALAAHTAKALPLLTYAALGLEDALWLDDAPRAHVLCGVPDDDDAPLDRAAAEQHLVRLVHVATRILAAHAAALPPTWHASAARAAVQGAAADDALAGMLAEVAARAADAAPYARILARLLAGVFSLSSAGDAEMEAWVRATSAKTPATVRAAVLHATRAAAASPAHDRARNELGAALGGTPPARAATEGATALYVLSCAAPPAALGVPLLPTQRAVMAMQSVQRWLASDEELPDAVFALLPSVCAELAPVLQSVVGRIDMLVDLVEENVNAADVGEPLGWTSLHTTLQLLDTLDTLRDAAPVAESLATHKASLRTALYDAFVRLCALAATPAFRSCAVHAPCVALLVRLVRAWVPPSALAQDAAVAALLRTPTPVHGLQVAAYTAYAAATRDVVREQVVELAVDTAATPTPLDAALVQSVSRHAPLTPAVWEAPETWGDVFALLLQWLALFAHFAEASLALKARYVATLEQHALPATQLLPSVFALLGGAPRGVPAVRPLEVGRYAVDEVDIDALDPHDARALQVLAAHVYFRALQHLPTQVRDWFWSVRDRQLSLHVSHWTAKGCTPLLAERELRHLRDPDALARLQDEAMAVKILSSNEVVATYTVDEHPMEIGVRLPADFPLHGVEIRDLKRVGVSEAQWRAWLLAVQQMLSGRNGLILDALMLFKKNAEAKFQGYEGAECAICYSIISPTDQTLPNKPCRTCKHKFHGSCLYKWVSTSGASTCPLCRSIL
ncbi:hypothetical protein MBRA1_003856 [Malassezia brasiliensis]|uniref:E3 ubiquitin-protein ligase listerin n=1 Tax=Malassezia brasiliensis TaxID=1821822 RepID=A0AAF0DVM8_9BASI|nr:hypothetical protein MBRA1_003856 [Malassezia brasiliensis]